MKIAVVGGTGTVGRHVVETLDRAGVEHVVVARSRGIDVVLGAGLAEAFAGVDTVIDVGNIITFRRSAAARYFRTAGRHIAEAERAAGVGHHVCLSIIGCDRVDFGYLGAKLVQESTAITSGVPWTILRASQFFEFAGQILLQLKAPIVVAPRVPIQPVAAADVADELVRLALAGPASMAPELAGPEPMELPDLLRRVQRERDDTRRLLAFTVPGAQGAALAKGALLPAPDGRRGKTDLGAWLAAGGARQ